MIDRLAANLRLALAFMSSGWRPAALIAALLALPLIFASPYAPTKFRIGLPRVFSGDEPHYLVLINSLLRDGDLDLANNYAAVHQGDPQAGLHFSGAALDHHTVWFEGTTRRNWLNIYETDPASWDHDGNSVPVPRLRAGQSSPMEGHGEISTHPSGLALILGPLLFPFRGTGLLEPAAILCSALGMIAAMLVFRALIRTYKASAWSADLATAVTFLGTPLWHYGRALFTESFLTLFCVASYSLVLRGRSPLAAGLLIGMGVLLKPTLAILGVPLLILLVFERNYDSVALFMLPVAAAVAVTVGLNALLLGSPWRAVQEWIPGSFFEGAWQMFASPQRGLLITAPAIVVAALAWPQFINDHRRDAVVLLAGVALYYGLFASFAYWHGGACYSIRHVVPVLPLMFASLASLSDIVWWRSRVFRGVTAALCILSVIINGHAAIQYWKSWNTNLIYANLTAK